MSSKSMLQLQLHAVIVTEHADCPALGKETSLSYTVWHLMMLVALLFEEEGRQCRIT